MSEIYLKAAAFLLTILLGHLLRRANVFGPEAQRVLAKLNLTVTLPAVIIVNFSKSTVSLSLILVLVLALAETSLLTLGGYFVSRGQKTPVRAAYMLSCSGYNIGSFALPYVQSFLPALGTVATCVYDAGNAVLCTGGAYSMANAMLKKQGDGFHPLPLLKKLLSSPAIVTNLIMFVLGVLNIRLPQAVIALVTPAANANVFCAMFMLGLMLHIEFRWAYLARILQILGYRMVMGIAFAALAWFVLPFPLAVRQALVLVPFSPITSVAPAFTQMMDGDEGLASCVNSIGILVSLVMLSVLIAVMGL